MGQGECVIPGVRVVAPHVGQSPLLYAAVVQIASLESLSRQLVFHTFVDLCQEGQEFVLQVFHYC